MNYTLRRATPDDTETLARFGERLAQESEGKTLDAQTIRAGVRSVFKDGRDAFYLLAESKAGRPAGSLMVTTEWSDWRDGVFWWIQSVYVAPEHRRQGVYQRLYAHVRREGEAAPDVCGLRLYVERENAAARAAYEALGMRETTYRMYEVAW
jgi:ribosomal protein S18 acetylase RimI-like enzyme